MKRYLAFFGDNFYPDGGMGDFLSDHDNFQDALDATIVEQEAYPEKFFSSAWSHVYDTVEKRVVTNWSR